ncbi:hypothetical protein [Streptomyces sp. NPDC019890]|uniref:hypothetical protein n=1 Tax=Streptomyces sp. NPDC019890 TaxID=3365064 RepID=UPI00384CEE75
MIAVQIGNSGLCVLFRPAATVRQANETSPGLYGVSGLYGIVEVTEEDEATGDRPHGPSWLEPAQTAPPGQAIDDPSSTAVVTTALLVHRVTGS